MVFGWAVLEALLECLDSILQCQSAGALHWFFTLLNHVKWCNPWGTARKVSSCRHTHGHLDLEECLPATAGHVHRLTTRSSALR